MRSIGQWPAGAASAAPHRRSSGSALVALVALSWTVGCGSGKTSLPDGSTADVPVQEPTLQEPMPVDTVPGNKDAQVIDGSTCSSVIEQHPDEGAFHIACTSVTDYRTNPPSSGNHFPVWAAYQTYSYSVPWGNLVHNLEHGAMVVVYNCPAGCADEVARAQTWIDTLPPDPDCGSTHRIILAPDPTLTVRWAASAWTWTLRSDCFEEAAFTQFYAAHYGAGLEVVCSSGYSSLNDLCSTPN